ncbi:RNA-binding cell elongation regulator Jag/EloR [Massilistercora timonensis]|uniref:RNA-binding cell elongation regulator Jag/EloR n=1 Tax=Massilistercora timonensis TaxID=2086584 RepID=UPI003AB72F74
MDEYITVSAKTLDDAITDALVELGVTSDQLDYIVIEKGSAGFLGIGMKQAVIKARRKQEEPVEAAEPEAVAEAPVKEESVKEEPAKEEKRDNRKKKNKKSSHHKDHKEQDEHRETAPVKEKKEVELAPVEEVTMETCRKFVQDVLEAMHMEDVQVTASVDEEGALAINMDGKDMGILIGKRGQTLDSLQYLTNRVANKMQSGYVRVKLDTEDYRRRRKETLENLAKNIASKVKRTRRTVALEPMNPYERRIIHSALQADPAVTTHSEGEEPYRRVVVTLVRK